MVDSALESLNIILYHHENIGKQKWKLNLVQINSLATSFFEKYQNCYFSIQKFESKMTYDAYDIDKNENFRRFRRHLQFAPTFVALRDLDHNIIKNQFFQFCIFSFVGPSAFGIIFPL